MPNITLRGDKGSALSFAELDNNFKTLGLTHGMQNSSSNVAIGVDTVTSTTADLTTVNATTVNASELTVSGDIYSGEFQLLDTANYDALGLKVVSPATKAKWSTVSVIEYGGTYTDELPFGSYHNPTISGECHGGSEASPAAVPNGKRAIQILGSARYGSGDGEVHTIANIIVTTNEAQSSTNRGGAITFRVTPNGDDTTRDMWKLDGNGLNSMNLAFDPNGDFTKTNWSTQSTDGFEVNSAITFNDILKINLTAYADLPSNPDASTNGLIAFLSTDGAGTQQNKLIYADAGNWKYVFDNSTVAAS